MLDQFCIQSCPQFTVGSFWGVIWFMQPTGWYAGSRSTDRSDTDRESGKKLGPETSWNLGSMSNASNGRNLKRLQRTLGALGKEGSPLRGKNAACHKTRIWKDYFRYEWTCMLLIYSTSSLKLIATLVALGGPRNSKSFHNLYNEVFN